jgi:hypothetical protein
MRVIRPERRTLASSGEYSLRAYKGDIGTGKIRKTRVKRLTSMACSALDSCRTPTVAFATRIMRITAGSTNAPASVESGESSKRARTKDMIAEARRMRTS